MNAAAILFVLAALGGVTLLALRLRGSNPPLAVAFVHGPLAATALVTLLVSVVRSGEGGLPLVALCLFGLAALGGLLLITLHLKGKLLPIPLVLGHGLIAASGLTVLLVHLYG